MAERQAAAARMGTGQRSIQDIPSFVTRYCREMFWVSPTDPVCAPLFQNHLALAANGPIVVPESDRKTCTDEDQYVNMHKNELCIVGVAKTHSRNVNLGVFRDGSGSWRGNMALGCFREASREIRKSCQNA